ncbi:replication termination factor 2 isoform 2-T2 [Salvelinus alpinus]|uniref:replication termination factor 2 isoform X2 n=1 Tax=Salvelinus sp. IW2-2015 TaxID=2691554 RepID=UPI000CDFC607|nr:protein RTF2 homolog isoform X2 [Salvelinus alpinus]
MFFEYSLFILQPACLDFLRAKLSGHSKKSPFVLFVKMGCDGGTIPKRHELVKGPKKVEKVDKNAALAARWKYCALSTEKLRSPIVTCDLGRLYNKDAVIEFLLDKSADRPNSEVVSHLRGIKDIKELNLTDNPAWEGERRNTKGDRYEDMHCAMFICPVVGLEMNGKHRFCFLRTCGCVFSDRALKEVKTEICHKCGDPFKEEDLVVLNGTKEEVEKLRKIMEEKRAKAKATKKSKKSKFAEAVSKPSESKENPDSSETVFAEGKTSTENGEDRSQPVPGPSGSSSSSKVVKPLAASGSLAESGSKRSIQSMEEKSETYKSLFTSHSSAKRTKAQTSNWVTHTPYHF